MARYRFLDPALLFSVGVSRRPRGWLAYAVGPLAVAIAVYVIVAATVLIIAPWVLTAVFLCGMMSIAFLAVGATPNSNPDRPTIVDFGFSLASLATGIVFAVNAEEYVNLALLADDEYDRIMNSYED